MKNMNKMKQISIKIRKQNQRSRKWIIVNFNKF